MTLDEVNDEGLFDVQPRPHLREGDSVICQTIWGDELATVVALEPDVGQLGGPLVECVTANGDRITIGSWRLRFPAAS